MSSVPPLDLSLVVVTHGRPDRLRQLLRSVREHPPAGLRSVILVDDSPDPPDYAAEFPELPVEHHRLAERAFISRAKNLGLSRVRTPLLAFVDDDNRVDAGSFAGPIGRFDVDARCGAVMPSVLYLRRPDLVWVYATPFTHDRWAFDLVGRNAPRVPALEGRLVRTDALPNCSVVRTDAAREIGGFDERLPVNSSADFCQRLQRAGWSTWADTGAFVYHDVEAPGTPGYWAAHSVDLDRIPWEVHDWFRFQFALRPREPFLRSRALRRAAPFLAAKTLGFCLRRDVPCFRATIALGRGVVRGLRSLDAAKASAIGS